MKIHQPLFLAVVSAACAAAPLTCLGDEIPKIAGQPLDHPGVRKNNVDIVANWAKLRDARLTVQTGHPIPSTL